MNMPGITLGFSIVMIGLFAGTASWGDTIAGNGEPGTGQGVADTNMWYGTDMLGPDKAGGACGQTLIIRPSGGFNNTWNITSLTASVSTLYPGYAHVDIKVSLIPGVLTNGTTYIDRSADAVAWFTIPYAVVWANPAPNMPGRHAVVYTFTDFAGTNGIAPGSYYIQVRGAQPEAINWNPVIWRDSGSNTYTAGQHWYTSTYTGATNFDLSYGNYDVFFILNGTPMPFPSNHIVTGNEPSAHRTNTFGSDRLYAYYNCDLGMGQNLVIPNSAGAGRSWKMESATLALFHLFRWENTEADVNVYLIPGTMTNGTPYVDRTAQAVASGGVKYMDIFGAYQMEGGSSPVFYYTCNFTNFANADQRVAPGNYYLEAKLTRIPTFAWLLYAARDAGSNTYANGDAWAAWSDPAGSPTNILMNAGYDLYFQVQGEPMPMRGSMMNIW